MLPYGVDWASAQEMMVTLCKAISQMLYTLSGSLDTWSKQGSDTVILIAS